MANRREFIIKGTIAMTGMSLMNDTVAWSQPEEKFVSRRPPVAQRKFVSKAVEEIITSVKGRIKDPKVAWMFENCFPNTLDTTVEPGSKNNKSDTFVITGDIHAMWLRDSSAQVWPYLQLASKDAKLRSLLSGVVHRQVQCVLLDPYANAFNKELTPGE